MGCEDLDVTGEDLEVADPSGKTRVFLPDDERLQPGESWWEGEERGRSSGEDPGDIPSHCPQVGETQQRTCCSYLPCTRVIVTDQTGKRKCMCPGLGLFYIVLSALFFSINSLLVKKITNLHSVEISALRCLFQILFLVPGLTYHKTGFLGPKDQRPFLLIRGFLGSSAMILIYYAVQSMPLADATVITYSRPAITCIFACIFLKEKCTVWDIVFMLFTITGVILIARPPFLFGLQYESLGDNYTDRLKGTIAAVGSAVSASLTLIILRKMGKSVHYLLSVWYYAVIGLIMCAIVLFAIGEWRLPACGVDRLLLLIISILGLGGQIFQVKAVQIERAGSVAIMRTMDVIFAFILQAVFLNHTPTVWTVGGALCIIINTVRTAICMWFTNSKKNNRQN